MTVLSAGIVLWRNVDTASGGSIEVLLGHLGGPFWARKDDRAWSIPKGLPDPGESPIDAARREFTEELGLPLPPGELVELGEFRQSSKKTVIAWALELAADHPLDPATAVSNTFEMEWPPKSGRHQEFPEIDRAEWFDLDAARSKVVTGQGAVFDLLHQAIGLG
ncbi:MAG: NUDIX domain-containing protein [Ilumatobacter sp.]|uniref:NUDIX domain-containing protein n=1 Tax=Ilumatobacter sp. TaxID=1967498 RepID=UPI003C712CA1